MVAAMGEYLRLEKQLERGKNNESGNNIHDDRNEPSRDY
jgi:hypothetical protein